MLQMYSHGQVTSAALTVSRRCVYYAEVVQLSGLLLTC
jgi:hypothetical protein